MVTFRMSLDWDEAKRQTTLRERGLDFADAEVVFAGPTLEFRDERREYGEVRFNTIGVLHGRMAVVVWTARGGMRRHQHEEANEREQARYGAMG